MGLENLRAIVEAEDLGNGVMLGDLRPATLDDVTQLLSGLPPDQLIQVLEGIGAERAFFPEPLAVADGDTGDDALWSFLGPGSYLVLPLEGQNSTENGTVLPLPTPQESSE